MYKEFYELQKHNIQNFKDRKQHKLVNKIDNGIFKSSGGERRGYFFVTMKVGYKTA